jgi:hypothetical protein
MGLILWIDKNTFATGLVERVFKKKLLPFYSLNSVLDFVYLIEDIKPTLIVLDGDTYLENPEAFTKQYNSSPDMQLLPFVLLDPKSDFSFIKKKLGEIQKPFDPFTLPDTLEKFLSVH